MAELRDIEDLLDLCMARSEDVLSQERWDELAALRGSVRMRRGFVGAILAVALAGATGSGKSSILNALCGEDLAVVGVRRPTTARSLAAVPRGSSSDLDPFLELLGVDETIAVDSLRDVVIVDLPDMDSRLLGHRSAVEAALRVVDAVVWVLDPEKYADRVLHKDFLAPQSSYGGQFIFCLNKADRLGSDVGRVTESLRSHLVGDGFVNPEIVVTVAAAGEGFGVAVDELSDALARRFDHKRTAQIKIAIDVHRCASRYWQMLDEGFDARSEMERDATAVAMASFVSLGIAAFELHNDLSEAAGG